jgi:pyridoxine 4-dehydrogenase
LNVLRHAVAEGVNHIDTAQFYGLDVANELIHAALYPYPEELVLVSKVGARRDSDGIPEAQRPKQLREEVLANLESLQLDQVPVVNLRRHPEAGVPFDEQVAAMVTKPCWTPAQPMASSTCRSFRSTPRSTPASQC